MKTATFQLEIVVEHVLIDKLVPYAGNPRRHPKEQIAKLAASIKEFGFTVPILIKHNAIVAGHGRYEAAKLLERATVPCIRVDHMTREQVRAYMIADNQIALESDWDEEKLAAEIAALNEADFDMKLLGFTDDELASLNETGTLGQSREPRQQQRAGEQEPAHDGFVTVMIRIPPDQYRDCVRPAIDEMKQISGTDSDGEALHDICEAWRNRESDDA